MKKLVLLLLLFCVLFGISAYANDKIELGTDYCESGLLVNFAMNPYGYDNLIITVITEKGLVTYDCLSKIKIDDTIVNGEDAYMHLVKGSIIKYLLNCDGHVAEIRLYGEPIKTETDAAYSSVSNKIGELLPFSSNSTIIFGNFINMEYTVLEPNLLEGLSYDVDVYEENGGYTTIAVVKEITCTNDKNIIKSAEATLCEDLYNENLSLNITGEFYNYIPAGSTVKVYNGDNLLGSQNFNETANSFSITICNVTQEAQNYSLKIMVENNNQAISIEYTAVVIYKEMTMKKGLLLDFRYGYDNIMSMYIICDNYGLAYSCAPKIIINGTLYVSDNINSVISKGNMIKFLINSDGLITQIKTYGDPIKSIINASYSQTYNQISGLAPFESNSSIIFACFNGNSYETLEPNLTEGLIYDVDVYEENDGYTTFALVKSVTYPQNLIIIKNAKAQFDKRVDESIFLDIKGNYYSNTVLENCSAVIELYDGETLIKKVNADYIDSLGFQTSIPEMTDECLRYTVKIHLENNGVKISNEYQTNITQNGISLDSGLIKAAGLSMGDDSNLVFLVTNSKGEFEYTCTDTIMYNGVYSIARDLVNELSAGKPMRFMLNNEGFITAINTYQPIQMHNYPYNSSDYKMYDERLNKIGDLMPFNEDSIVLFGNFDDNTYTEIAPNLVDVYEEYNGYTTLALVKAVKCTSSNYIKNTKAVLNMQFDGTYTLDIAVECYLTIPTGSKAVIELYNKNSLIRTLYLDNINDKIFSISVPNMTLDTLDYAVRLWIVDINYNVISNVKIIGDLYSQFEVKPLIESTSYDEANKELIIDVSYENIGFTTPKVFGF